MEVKICGIRDVHTACTAADAGARALGFVFAISPRRVAPEMAARIVAGLDADIARVAVFRHPTAREVESVLERFPADIVQAEPGPGLEAARSRGVCVLPVLHDDEGTPWPPDLPAAGAMPVLIEAAGIGGRGVAPDWDRAAAVARHLPLVLAGGLTPENVRGAIRHVGPAAVDVSSGVESSRGVKDPDKIRAFVAAAHAARMETRPVGHRPRPIFERAPG